MTFFDSGVSEVERHDTQQNNTQQNDIPNEQKKTLRMTKLSKMAFSIMTHNEDSQHNIKSSKLSIKSFCIHSILMRNILYAESCS
jgi:hypothetical protein